MTAAPKHQEEDDAAVGNNYDNQRLDHHHHDDATNKNHVGSTEAGIVRGVSRSIATRVVAAPARTAGRTMAKFPSVGKLPLRTARRARVPVRRVAKYTDRMSTGLEVLESASASSSSATKETRQKKRWTRVQAFAGSMLKNTVLGAIVFETFCQVVSSLSQQVVFLTTTSSNTTKEGMEPEKTISNNDNKDIFETAPIPVHFLAGAAAGSIQAIGSTVWDSTTRSITTRRIVLSSNVSSLSIAIGQHAAAHSVLFGSYETFKRTLLQKWNPHLFDPEVHNEIELSNGHSLRRSLLSSTLLLPHQRPEYLSAIVIAGGLAGQAQHIVSHILEQTTPGQQPFRFVTKRSLPSLKSTLWAFPPSAIAFVAFEYGKDKVVELSEDEEETDTV
jgi:hypothetical protein